MPFYCSFQQCPLYGWQPFGWKGTKSVGQDQSCRFSWVRNGADGNIVILHHRIRGPDGKSCIWFSLNMEIWIELKQHHFIHKYPSGSDLSTKKHSFMATLHTCVYLLKRQRAYIIHSLIISREVLILTLSIFNALNVCISWYSLCPRECTEKYFPRECISRTLPRENIGNTSSRGKHWQCSGNDESSSLMIYRRQAKCQDNGCNRKIITWTF